MARSVKSEAKQRLQVSSRAAIALHVQIGFLLSGEARVGQVFGRGRGAHRDVERHGAVALQLAIRLGDGFLQVLRQRRR